MMQISLISRDSFYMMIEYELIKHRNDTACKKAPQKTFQIKKTRKLVDDNWVPIMRNEERLGQPKRQKKKARKKHFSVQIFAKKPQTRPHDCKYEAPK